MLSRTCLSLRGASGLLCAPFPGPNVTFILNNITMKWTQAQSYCREHHTDLASIRNITENQKVRDVAAGHSVWIGLFRECWKWSDGMMKVKFENKNNLDLNDPAMMEAMLKQVNHVILLCKNKTTK
uniref:C-type lectin domain-containing protein n=1 Tax=Sander lucioperca TaxID=283035 RepID=A0A8C9Y614_SANLU